MMHGASTTVTDEPADRVPAWFWWHRPTRPTWQVAGVVLMLLGAWDVITSVVILARGEFLGYAELAEHLGIPRRVEAWTALVLGIILIPVGGWLAFWRKPSSTIARAK